MSRFFKGAELPLYYFNRYRKAMSWGLFALVVLDFTELLPPLILKYAVDSILIQGPFRDVVLFSGAYLLVFLFQGLLRYAWRVCLIRSSHQAGRDLRGSFVHQLFHLHPGFFEKNRVGDLMALANSDVDAIRQFVGPGILVLADALFYLAFVPIAMLWLDWKLALISFATLPFIPWIAYRLEELIHDRFKASQDQFSALSAMAQENLNGIRVVKALAVEDVQHERFRKLGEKYVELNLKLARADKSFGPVMDFFTSLGIVLLLWFGGRFVIEDSLTLGTFVAFQRYIQKMVWPMIAIGFGASMYQRSSASSHRLKQIFHTPNQVPDSRSPLIPERTQGHIRIQGLTFRYPGTQSEVLKNLTLEIQPGMRVAFVGSVGSGKSTLLSLIPRLYPVPEGTLFLDGVDVNHWPLDELRRRIGMVPQEVFLFSETLRENLLFGVEDHAEEAREARAQETLRLSSLQDDLLALPSHENTQLGERGVNLSGGQKQRVSLGRALAREPEILILDDSLSAVDVRTEQRILSELRNRETRKTELIAAHRISTVQEADLIVVLDQGEVVQQGTHSELIHEEGLYRTFHEQQKLKEELEAFLDQLPSESSAAEVVP